VGHVVVVHTTFAAAAVAAAAAAACVTPSQAWVKEQLGADEVVDYHASDFAEVYSSPDKHFDIVVDCLVSQIPTLRATWCSMMSSALQAEGGCCMHQVSAACERMKQQTAWTWKVAMVCHALALLLLLHVAGQLTRAHGQDQLGAQDQRALLTHHERWQQRTSPAADASST
jgi:hypothetical protein